MRGALAQVEVRQRFVNPGPTEMAATYEFDLPRGATVTSFTFKGERGAEQALALPGVFTTVGIDARPVIGIDRRPRDPRERRAGSGFTRTLIHKGIPAKLVLTGHGDSAIKIRKSARSASAPSRR